MKQATPFCFAMQRLTIHEVVQTLAAVNSLRAGEHFNIPARLMQPSPTMYTHLRIMHA